MKSENNKEYKTLSGPLTSDPEINKLKKLERMENELSTLKYQFSDWNKVVPAIEKMEIYQETVLSLQDSLFEIENFTKQLGINILDLGELNVPIKDVHNYTRLQTLRWITRLNESVVQNILIFLKNQQRGNPLNSILREQ